MELIRHIMLKVMFKIVKCVAMKKGDNWEPVGTVPHNTIIVTLFRSKLFTVSRTKSSRYLIKLGGLRLDRLLNGIDILRLTSGVRVLMEVEDHLEIQTRSGQQMARIDFNGKTVTKRYTSNRDRFVESR